LKIKVLPFSIALATTPGCACAETLVRWIQFAPGSTSSALQAGSYGDAPTGATPTILARALITQASSGCPPVVLENGVSITTRPRFDGNSLSSALPTVGGLDAFVSRTAPGTFAYGDPIATTDWTVCEAVIPADHVSANIDGATLKLPVATPRRIVVLADSGCRSAPNEAQNCHDPAAFPLQRIATEAARLEPDLIVHVGDYFYRDAPCAPGKNLYGEKQGSITCNNPASADYVPWGDTFDAWNGDFFFPAKDLLQMAPWIMVRGNHESCGRGARGWFALLDAHPYDRTHVICERNAGAVTVSGDAPVYSGDFTPTYVVPAGRVRFLVHDSSFATDLTVDSNMARNFDLDLSNLLSALTPGAPAVIATHRPAYALVAGAYDANGNASGGNRTEQYLFSGHASPHSAFASGVTPQSIAFLLSGHVHQFEYLNFADNSRFAPQLVVGTGGDNLDYSADPAAPKPPSANAPRIYQFATSGDDPPKKFALQIAPEKAGVAEAALTNAYAAAEFGFAMLEANPVGFDVQVYDTTGNRKERCEIRLEPRRISCGR